MLGRNRRRCASRRRSRATQSAVHSNSWKGIKLHETPLFIAGHRGSYACPSLASARRSPWLQVSPRCRTGSIRRGGSPATYSSSAEDSLPASHALAGAAAAAAAPAAPAEGSSKPFSGLGVGVKFGIGGIGFDAATPIIPGRLNVRGGAGFFSYTASEPSTI